MNRLKIGDDVIVVAGKDKGKRGKIVGFAKNDRCVVEGINMMKKHVKPNPNKGEKGGIVAKEAPIHVSNVMPFNDASGKGERIGFKTEGDQKVRVFKSNDQEMV